MTARLDCEPASLRGELRFDQPLAGLNSWRVGGASDGFYAPADRDDLAHFLRDCAGDAPVFCLGLGSNVLVRDGGVRGFVLSLRKGFDFMRFDGRRVAAGAGAACAQLARRCAKRGLAGLEFMAGIPGTVGGALAMNAGAFGGETWDRLAKVETMTRAGACRTRPASDLRASYRKVEMGDAALFLSGEWLLDERPQADAEAALRALVKRRDATQPSGRFSCGSVFRNPENMHAARLIEDCGLKGARVGAAEVSARHANFIVHRGGARAADIEALIEHVRETVRRRTGVALTPEVKIIGEPL